MEEIKNLSVKYYMSPITEWSIIPKENIHKSGIYALISKNTNKVYIGSDVNLYNRLNDYFQTSYLE